MVVDYPHKILQRIRIGLLLSFGSLQSVEHVLVTSSDLHSAYVTVAEFSTLCDQLLPRVSPECRPVE